ncbi:12694_t:CDS:1, partial [Ambispora gerdemannii]
MILDKPKGTIEYRKPSTSSPSRSRSKGPPLRSKQSGYRLNGSSPDSRFSDPPESESSSKYLTRQPSTSYLRAKSPSPSLARSLASSNSTLSPSRQPLISSKSNNNINTLGKPRSPVRVPPAKFSLMQQLKHEDSAMRIDGIINLAHSIERKIAQSTPEKPGIHQELRKSPIPPDEELIPILLNLLNDNTPEVITT